MFISRIRAPHLAAAKTVSRKPAWLRISTAIESPGCMPSRSQALASALTRSSSSRYVIEPPSSITAVRSGWRAAATTGAPPSIPNRLSPRTTSAVVLGPSIPSKPLRKHSRR